MRSLSTRVAGLLILVLGAWGALVPFVGPYFHFTLGPTKSWTWTSGRLWLDVLPGIAAVIGGLMLLRAGPRPAGKLGALLALAAGVWFAIGPDASLLWNAGGAQGAAHGSVGIRVLEMITYHTALGVVIAALAGFALPGLFARRAAAVEAGVGAAALAEHETAVGRGPREVDEPVGTGESAAVDHEPAAVGETTDVDHEPAAAGETTAVDHEPAAVDHEPAAAGETTAVDHEPAVADHAAAGDREPVGVGAPAAGGRAEFAGARSRATAGNGTAVAENAGEYGTQPAPSPTASGSPASTGMSTMSAPVAETEGRRRRRGGLLSALRR